ncbi:MAG: lipid A biosynthesis acyltransferase [Burkholderiales bacterium]|nr:lipid A biosynthesis acyltransferase [Burkholderiales bacterium]
MTRAALVLLWLLRLLPLRLLAAIGNGFGLLLYALGRERRNVCLVNLARCLPELGVRERHALARRHFQAFARTFLERAILWWGSAARIRRLVRIEGMEHFEAVRGGPLILLAPHFVGLDMGAARVMQEFDIVSIYARQKNEVFDAVLYAGRMRFGRVTLLSRQHGVRPALRAMQAGRPFYYLPDMDYGQRDTIFVPFFGNEAATITGVSRLARLAGARVLPCITRMLPRGEGYVVRFLPAWEDYPGASIEADTRRMNAFIEEQVRQMPEQYLWVHKRFKTRPPGEASWY